MKTPRVEYAEQLMDQLIDRVRALLDDSSPELDREALIKAQYVEMIDD